MSSLGLREDVARDRVALVSIPVPHRQEADVRDPRSHDAGGLEELAPALLQHHPPDRTHHQLVLGDPELCAELPHSLVGAPIGPELGEVDAVAQIARTAATGDAQTLSPTQVLGRLIELEIAASRRDPFGREHRARAGGGDPRGWRRSRERC